MALTYIAYGSNMSEEQMKFRCPDSELLGTGYLKDYRLEFYTHATIEPNKYSKVPVAVWKISDRDLENLDMYEGFPRYYEKELLTVNVEGREVRGFAYIMNICRPNPPTIGYFNGIADAYANLGFVEELDDLNKALCRSYNKRGF